MKETIEVKFRVFQQHDYAEVQQMIFQLYHEDPEGELITSEKISATIKELADHPEKGRIIVFTIEAAIVGYAIIIYFWSNELGGNVLHIDELLVKKLWRKQGISTRFFDYILNDEQGPVKALQLEVTSSNRQTLSYYKNLGFESSNNTHLIKSLFK